MNILMFTNTFTPHVGGVARSVEAFAGEYRALGHRVMIVAPTFEHAPEHETDVIRVPAIQNFNGSDFSVRLPLPAHFFPELWSFEPDVIHSHHPFLLGDAAIRMASRKNVPIVFTHHTMYEQYTHYVPGDSCELQEFVIQLSTGYANLCHAVIAPSGSVKEILERRGVIVPIHVIPTGVDVDFFSKGDRVLGRDKYSLPRNGFVIGHAGRLAQEKNLKFLCTCVADFLLEFPDSWFLLVGDGPMREQIEHFFQKRRVRERVISTGNLSHEAIVNAYAAMDVFAFSSSSETQGIVLLEAMAAGVPVVALDAPGVREVVESGKNGELLPGQDREKFVSTLRAFHGNSLTALQDGARARARDFSFHISARRALDLYESLRESRPHEVVIESSSWLASLRLVEAQWALVANQAQSARTTLTRSRAGRWRFVRRMSSFLRRTRFRLSRSEWEIRALGLGRSATNRADPGLILLQIDGLARVQFEKALANGKLPFLRSLIRREGYEVSSFYSGFPSTTPAVQAELFYGEKGAVPAFAFYEHESGDLWRMFDSSAASTVEDRLQREQEGLLRGGSCYSDIFTGGAAEAHFCPAAFGWGGLLQKANPATMCLLLIFNLPSLVRIGVLVMIEAMIATIDSISGTVSGQLASKELSFVVSRVSVSILLREMITLAAQLDAARGLPVIHANFLGYDEQSHRRGPQSQFAFWTLKGIDGAIRRITNAGRKSGRRDYEIWIYSDHGQQNSVPFENVVGRRLADVLEDVFGGIAIAGKAAFELGVENNRTHWLGGKLFQKMINRARQKPPPAGDGADLSGPVKVASPGPLAHVYCSRTLSDDEKEILAARMLEGGIPLIMWQSAEKRITALTDRGQYELPAQTKDLFHSHPFAGELEYDIPFIFTNPDTGTFVLSGWRGKSKPLTFSNENGSHGGPGEDETHGFALLPARLSANSPNRPYLRPSDLRNEALNYLRRARLTWSQFTRARRTGNSIRILTYNVHGCLGFDGTLSSRRIARVLAEFNPDIIALQEVDVGRARSNHEDQPKNIARKLSMRMQFSPALHMEEERYGDALLSRFPIHFIRQRQLPSAPRAIEPRGALWAEIEIEGKKLQIIVTHLGLDGEERRLQATELDNWVLQASKHGPVVLCGDFNTLPQSDVHEILTRHLVDAALKKSARPSGTWPSRYPISRIDYIFASRELNVRRFLTPRTYLTKTASDHLPVICDIEFIH